MPYRSGHPVDTIPHTTTTIPNQRNLAHLMKPLVGSILRLSGATRLDLATITSILSKHTCNPSPGHIRAAKYAIKYLKGTKNRGIKSYSSQNSAILTHFKFPANPSRLLTLTDANWGGQD